MIRGAATGLRAGPPAAARARLPWRTAIASAFVTTLIRPAAWAFGLLGFLAGGGIVLVAWPILVLPTPTGLQNDLGGPANRLVLGTPSVELVVVAVAAVLVGVAIVITACAVGAWAERQGIQVALDAATAEGLAVEPGNLAGAPGVGRITVIRLLALAPVLVAIALAWGPVYDVAYHELILPEDLVTPLPLRVVRQVPALLAGVGAVWLVSDAAGAIAVRHLVLNRRSIGRAWLLGWADVVRLPVRTLATAVVGLVTMVLLLGPALLASGSGWSRVRDLMLGNADPLSALAAVVIWVTIWLAGLALVGVAVAARAAAWTFATARLRHEDPRPGV